MDKSAVPAKKIWLAIAARLGLRPSAGKFIFSSSHRSPSQFRANGHPYLRRFFD
jgi:hypothetical protein